MANLAQSKPALVSLSIRRTTQDLADLDTTDQPIPPAHTSFHPRPRPEPTVDHSEELKWMSSIVQRQSFDFVAVRNSIHDARLRQSRVLAEFHSRAMAISQRLADLSYTLLQRLADLNRHVDHLSAALCPVPLFQRMLVPPCTGRITGLDVAEQLLAATTSGGDLALVDLTSAAPKAAFRPLGRVGLFCPQLFRRGPTLCCFSLSASGHLLLSQPATSEPINLIDTRVECFAICADGARRDSFDLVTGHSGSIQFHTINSDGRGVSTLGSSKRIDGVVCRIVVDAELEAAFVITRRRLFYSVSSVFYSTVASHEFEAPVFDVGVTRMFIVLAVAPNDVVFLARNREKIIIICRITIEAGLRHFAAAGQFLYVLTKRQTVEMRPCADPSAAETICAVDVAEFDEEQFIAIVAVFGQTVYLTHGDQISVWQ
jgi:hypothetical protein